MTQRPDRMGGFSRGGRGYPDLTAKQDLLQEVALIVANLLEENAELPMGGGVPGAIDVGTGDAKASEISVLPELNQNRKWTVKVRVQASYISGSGNLIFKLYKRDQTTQEVSAPVPITNVWADYEHIFTSLDYQEFEGYVQIAGNTGTTRWRSAISTGIGKDA